MTYKFYDFKNDQELTPGNIFTRYGKTTLSLAERKIHKIYPLIDENPNIELAKYIPFSVYEKGPVILRDDRAVATYHVSPDFIKLLLGSRARTETLLAPADSVQLESTDGLYTPNQTSGVLTTTSSRLGSGLTITLETDNEGVLASVTVNDPGTNYLHGEFVTVDTTSIGGAATDQFLVTTYPRNEDPISLSSY